MKGRTVLVTGAGAGVGAAIAEAAAAAGARVIVAAHHDNGAEVAARIDGEFVRCDVTDPAGVEAAFAVAGVIDAVVHNATSRLSSVPAKLAEVTPDEWRVHADVSLLGAQLCAINTLPRFRGPGGRFVVMTSPAGMEGSPMNPLYGVVKGGLRGFAKSLAREWAPQGHTVNAVSLLAATGALTTAFANDPTLEARLSEKVPMGWFGDPLEDIAPAVLFLLSDASRYITGQTLVVDGGRFMNL